MTGLLGSVLAGAVAGPAVVLLAASNTLTGTRPGPAEVTAVSILGGFTVGFVWPLAEGLVLLPLAVLGCAAAVVDAREGRLPDRLTGALLACTVLGALLTGAGIGVLAAAALGAAGAAVCKFLLSEAIGWGDVKLVPSLVAVLAHCGTVVTGAVLVWVLMVLTAVAVGIIHRGTGTRAAVVPYGPALVLGAFGAAVS